MPREKKRRAVGKAVHGPPEDKSLTPATEPEAAPEPTPKMRYCPHCDAKLFPHDPTGSKAGCNHCNRCGCCFGPDGLPRPGHPVCALATE